MHNEGKISRVFFESDERFCPLTVAFVNLGENVSHSKALQNHSRQTC